MTRIVRLRIDRLRLDRAAAGLTGTLSDEIRAALRTALTARQHASSPNWSAATRPALRHVAETLARKVPVNGKGGAE